MCQSINVESFVIHTPLVVHSLPILPKVPNHLFTHLLLNIFFFNIHVFYNYYGICCCCCFWRFWHKKVLCASHNKYYLSILYLCLILYIFTIIVNDLFTEDYLILLVGNIQWVTLKIDNISSLCLMIWIIWQIICKSSNELVNTLIT